MESEILESKIRILFLDINPGGVYIKELNNKDEYDIEIRDILTLLHTEKKEMDFINKITAMMTEKFGETGEILRYSELGRRIWKVSTNS